jgi:hypothetical protein
MLSFDLETKLMEFGTGDGLSKPWCIKHSILGCQVFGSNGSGKSSSMKTLALKYLRAGYGFLILSVKSERETWQEYCELAGRSSDFITIGPESHHRFDFMRYLSESDSGSALTSNLLNILKAVIRASDENGVGQSQDPFWQKSLDLLLYNTISLCQLAYGKVSVQGMYDIVQSAPTGQADEADSSNEQINEDGAFYKAFEAIRNEIATDYQQWQKTWTEDEKIWFSNKNMLEAAILEKFPQARTFKFVEQFFFETFKTLSGKTKSIILLSLSSFLFSLLQDPVYQIFCSSKITVTPEDTLDGKIILLDLPTKHWHEAGRFSQLIFKRIWQQQVEKRDIKKNARPVCLWSDESSEFLMEYDPVFQSTARASRISVVFIAQNVNQYTSAMGGNKSAERVASFLGTLNTKLFFSNSDVTTNKMASELIGDAIFFDPSRTVTTAEKFSQSDAVSLKVDRLVRPEKFVGLLTGGTENNCVVEAYIHVQGDKLFNGQNFKKIRFNQNYK